MKKTLHAEGEDYVYNTSCDEIMKEKVTFDMSFDFGVPGKWCSHLFDYTFRFVQDVMEGKAHKWKAKNWYNRNKEEK